MRRLVVCVFLAGLMAFAPGVDAVRPNLRVMRNGTGVELCASAADPCNVLTVYRGDKIVVSIPLRMPTRGR